jgi:hypothetical protein
LSHPVTSTDILRRARQNLTPPERWLKGKGTDGHAQCALWAILYASQAIQASLKEKRKAIRRVCFALGTSRPAELAEYQDHPDTTHEDVLRLFDTAIGGK